MSNMLQNNSREKYLNQARAYARRRFNALLATPDYRHCHISHCAAKALEETEKRFTDLGTFGVEGTTSDQDAFTIQYLNTGDSYESTICYYKGRFIVASFGDIAERYL